MDTEFAEIALEQRERAEERPLPAFAPQPEPMLPAPLPARARPRGRPFVKGQSGNPAGRPRRIHPSAAAIDYVIGRKSIRLARKVRDMALKGDRAMLKLWYQNAAAAQRASPDWPQMPLAEDRAQLPALRRDVAEAAARGAISPAQADALLRIVNTVLAML